MNSNLCSSPAKEDADDESDSEAHQLEALLLLMISADLSLIAPSSRKSLLKLAHGLAASVCR